MRVLNTSNLIDLKGMLPIWATNITRLEWTDAKEIDIQIDRDIGEEILRESDEWDNYDIDYLSDEGIRFYCLCLASEIKQ